MLAGTSAPTVPSLACFSRFPQATSATLPHGYGQCWLAYPCPWWTTRPLKTETRGCCPCPSPQHQHGADMQRDSANICRIKGKVSASSLAPGRDVCEAPVCFCLTITAKPSMLLRRRRLQPHGSARGPRSARACSPERCDIRKLIYTELKSKPFDTSKSRIFRTQHNKWLSCAQKFKVYVLGGQGRVMKRTWPSVSINRHSNIYCMSEKRNETIHRVGNTKYAKNDACMKCLLYAGSCAKCSCFKVLSHLIFKFFKASTLVSSVYR